MVRLSVRAIEAAEEWDCQLGVSDGRGESGMGPGAKLNDPASAPLLIASIKRPMCAAELKNTYREC